ncbi:hypothetical protein ACQCSX_16965 [Pseudarthrobacter sp. P1]|uniref:hypothetical protein n=1 Tax=Pseudarthrobacter sp. P1 TaxID=3418418 RepID=UPI003CF72969
MNRIQEAPCWLARRTTLDPLLERRTIRQLPQGSPKKPEHNARGSIFASGNDGSGTVPRTVRRQSIHLPLLVNMAALQWGQRRRHHMRDRLQSGNDQRLV